ncbi:hypothetical protein JJB11_04665 [Ramlibacter ginsenosidimutans]|uniref:Uncharacterized protein n=1 Tax=Ramlibacter ginsenosidimutans TaxID=502333 RepID=A0A934WLF9_9BURK|nr:hypothetical protein [Ramlibacter ginsenosidimutans]MBK6005373.1 hypothetical protein [Ramlibacter ginsenosidimutans]
MNIPLFLFCGGPAYDGEGRPKPLMKIREGRSLLVHFLLYLKQHRASSMPASVILLCDDGQEAAIQAALNGLSYPVPIHIRACGPRANTFEKFSRALDEAADRRALVQFGYPDIFSFDEFSEPALGALESGSSVHISAAALTSRFPRLIVDIYNNRIKGISNYTSPVPANPLHVFGGDLWGRVDQLRALVQEFRSQAAAPSPSLEYDFFFWLINHDKMSCVMLHGERMWIDSIRDVNQLLARMGDAL